ncbi:GNAT family N-acetyltransferase [Pseudoruegeria sp. HB172150]|uniref:GNAT family N-acetyltransferase n=1 Tax=Pseudoruegeria sp. HB172150 TaxID=2721164 RepID=UPI0015548208|nr:GNAT family N-acetyltransferase [Pseudoruegeria sp. HB172150]
MTGPVLQTERLTLRRPGASDEKAMLGFLMSPRAEFYGGPMDLANAWRKFATYVGQWDLRGYGMFAVVLTDTGETIGMAGPFHPGEFDEPEMSWLLSDAAHEGKGYAREASAAVLHHLFHDLGWQGVISYIDPANAPSLALAERLGARRDPSAVSPLPGCDTYRHMAPELVQ